MTHGTGQRGTQAYTVHVHLKNMHRDCALARYKKCTSHGAARRGAPRGNKIYFSIAHPARRATTLDRPINPGRQLSRLIALQYTPMVCLFWCRSPAVVGALARKTHLCRDAHERQSHSRHEPEPVRGTLAFLRDQNSPPTPNEGALLRCAVSNGGHPAYWKPSGGRVCGRLTACSHSLLCYWYDLLL